MDCLVSSNYDRAFRSLKPTAKSMTSKEKFFLIKCPAFLITYQKTQSVKIIEKLLDTMLPRYASILDEHVQSVKEWTYSIMHAVHHLFLTVIYAKDYYSPYARGQPIRWLIDSIICIIKEPSIQKKVNEKTSETILIDSALRILAEFIYEPDLLVYIKQLKVTEVFRSLISLPYESIELHAYLLLSYTLREDDIKASEKDSGRLLSNIFDKLRKKIRKLSKTSRNREIIEGDISLLINAVRALVQHDQIKSEILKQNALSLLLDIYYSSHNNQSKRLLLDILGSVTFDQQAAELLRGNTSFISLIEDMQETADYGIQRAAEKIIWNLINEPAKTAEREKKTVKEKVRSKDKKKKKEKPKKEEYEYDIMISYCHDDKELVYRIQKFLADKGFKIWFDRDNIYGPAMQAMAAAVETSEFIVICMSDSYKRSVYCQAEAEYAFRCKRNLLPVIVRQGYRADGWLGLIIGSRIYVDFCRLEYKNACELLLKEITLQKENKPVTEEDMEEAMSEQQSNSTSQIVSNEIELVTKILPERTNWTYKKRDTTKSTYRFSSVRKWTKTDVQDFLYDLKLYYMMPLCEFLTGLGLSNFFRMCQSQPTQFYTQLNAEFMSRFNGLHLPTSIFTQFLTELDHLFGSSSSSSSSLVKPTGQATPQSKSDATSQSSTRSTSPLLVRDDSRKFPWTTSVLPPPPPTQLSVQYSTQPNLQPTIPPTVTKIQTRSSVQITEEPAYQIESLVNPSTICVTESTQNSSAVRSEPIGPYGTEFTYIDEQTRQNQQMNTVPQGTISYSHQTQSTEETVYS